MGFLEVGLLGHMACLYLIYKKLPVNCSKWLYHFLLETLNTPVFLHPHQHLTSSFRHSSACVVASHFGFNLCVIVNNYFTCLLAIITTCLVKYQTCPFLNWFQL